MAILDQFGRPFERKALYGYEATSRSRRTVGYNPTSAHLNTLLQASGHQLIAIARDLVRRNPWARNAENTWVANAIGNGIAMEPVHENPTERRRLARLWRQFSNQCDWDGKSSINGLQEIGGREIYQAGETLGLFHRLERPEFPGDIPLRIQMLEAEHLPFEKTSGAEPPNDVRCGIEYSPAPRRKRVAYHLYREHPGESTVAAGSRLTDRYPAGDVLHCFPILRAGQIRGETAFASTIIKLHELDQYDDAEVVRKKLATLFIGWTKDLSPAETALEAEEQVDGITAPDGVGFLQAEPGTILPLPPNTDMGWNQPADVGTMYESFMRVQLRSLAAALKLAYYQLSGDVGDANYSSLRAALIEIRRQFEQFQYNCLEFQFCRPIWREFILACVAADYIKANRFDRDPQQYLDVAIRPPAWPWIDPRVDIAAEKDAVRCGFKSRQTVVRERGEDPDQVDEQQAADNQRADQLGIAYDSDGRRPATGQQPNNGGSEKAPASTKKAA